MKICLNNKTPVLTEESSPSWCCPNVCCFQGLYMGHPHQLCYYFNEIRCTERYCYTLQNKGYDIFKL